MANADYLMVYIRRRDDAAYAELETKMNLSVDWFRIDENLWVLYTTSDAERWYARLSPLVKDSGRVFICRLDVTNRQGWMGKSFWTWLKREKTSS